MKDRDLITVNDEVKKAINNAKASLAIEGLYVTPEVEHLIELKLYNTITEDKFHEQILNLINTKK
jgi:hypothetical protein